VVTPDGRYVVFVSNSNNLAGGDSNFKNNVYVRDTAAGTTTRVSLSSSGQAPSFDCDNPDISANGRYVVFASDAPLVTGDTNQFTDIFFRDLEVGATTRVNVGPSGLQGELPTFNPAISQDGRWVVFSTRSSRMVAGDTNDQYDVFLRDLQSGTNTRVSVTSAGEQTTTPGNGEGVISRSAISADGRFVVFDFEASNVVPNDTNGDRDIFLHDRDTGQTTRVNVGPGGVEATGTGGFGNFFRGSSNPDISADGRYIVYESYASNLVAGDTNGMSDIFLYDTQTATTTLVSRTSAGSQTNQDANNPSISGDGLTVAFDSKGEFAGKEVDLEETDIFVRNLTAGTTKRASVMTPGIDTQQAANDASVSSDGRFVSFTAGSSLIPPANNTSTDIFLYDGSQDSGSGAFSLKGKIIVDKNGKKKFQCTVKKSGKKAAKEKISFQQSTSLNGNYTDIKNAKTDKQGVALLSFSKGLKNKFVRCAAGGSVSAGKKVPK
jgi:Tol biopolymer transport system component